LFLAIPACNRFTPVAPDRGEEVYVDVPGSVGFDIKLADSGNGSFRVTANYTSQGRTAKFRVEFGPPKTIDFPMRAGEGRFVSEPGSDASVLLLDLKKALEAKALPNKVQRSESLPFTFVNIGEDLSQAPGGGFNVDPPGNWTAMKLFLGKGKQESQLFLNINPVIRKGQFSIKDPDYGDLALVQLAKVL
jgi:hypothetical protein